MAQVSREAQDHERSEVRDEGNPEGRARARRGRASVHSDEGRTASEGRRVHRNAREHAGAALRR